VPTTRPLEANCLTMTRAVRWLALVVGLVFSFAGCKRNTESNSTSEQVRPDEWPFSSVMVHRGSRVQVVGWTEERDQYGSLWVDSVPLLYTQLVDRVECREGTVWIYWNDYGTRQLADATADTPETKLLLAFYVDQVFVNAPAIQAPIRKGATSMPSVPCVAQGTVGK
jgi:hypothetical protein